MRLRARYTLLFLFTLPFGLAVRFAQGPWPYAISKYGGSALWAIAIYWLVSLILPRRTASSRVAVSLAFTFVIEFFKLARTPALDAFRLTLPGKLVLGRVFSAADLVAYTAAILCAAALDRAAFSIPSPAKPGLR